MRKLFYKHATLYTLSSLLTKGISVLLVPLYTRFLSPRDYGLLDLVLATCTLVNLTIALEIHQAIARFYHEWTAEERRRHVSTATYFAGGVYTAFALGFLLWAGPLLERGADVGLEPGVVPAGSALIWTSGIFYILQSQLRWGVKANDYVASSVLFSVVTGVVTPALLVTHRGGVVDMLVGLAAGNAAGLAFCLWRGRQNHGARFSGKRLARMLGFSAPLVLSSLAAFATLYMDRFIILSRLTLDDLGLFSLATKFSSVTGIALVGVNSALTPLIYQHHRDAETRGQVETILEKYVLLASAIVLGALWFSEEALLVLTTGPFLGARSLVPPLVLASLIAGMYNFFPGLSIAKRTRAIAVINVAAMGVNFAATSMLVHWMGILGAAVAAVAVAAFVTGLYFLLGRADYPVAVAPRVMAGALAVLAASWGARALVPAAASGAPLAAKVAFCAMGLGALYLLGRATRSARPSPAA